jgi:hypothetical protein
MARQALHISEFAERANFNHIFHFKQLESYLNFVLRCQLDNYIWFSLFLSMMPIKDHTSSQFKESTRRLRLDE